MTNVTPDDRSPDEGDEVAEIDPESPARGVVDPDDENPPEPSEPA